jgi:hypothetical protein
MQEIILVIRRSITSREKKAGGTNAFDSLSGETESSFWAKLGS